MGLSNEQKSKSAFYSFRANLTDFLLYKDKNFLYINQVNCYNNNDEYYSYKALGLMEIRHLKLVKTVVEEGSLTNASKRLYLTQSALSHQLKEIENKFGAPLFQRINKRMVLTHVGKRVLRSANLILSELQSTENDVKRFISGDAGVLRISTECYTCYHWLPSLLKSYDHHFPNVEVRIIAEATRRPIQFLLEGKLDLAIISCLQADQMGDNNLSFIKLFTDEMVVVTNKHHRLASHRTICAEDFRNENLIVYTAPIEVLDIFQRVLIPASITPKKTIRIQLTEAIIEMVKAGLGITVMAKWAVKPYLKSRQLLTIPLAKPGLTRTWYAAIINEKNTPHYLQCFIEHLTNHPIA